MLSRRISASYSFFVLLPVLILAIATVFVSVPVRAQVAGGSLSGTITDPSGGQVPQATVVIKNMATGVERALTANTNGYYTAPNLLPGEYLIIISATGFNKSSKSGITINVGSQQTYDAVLQIGTVTHTVEVSTDAPSVQLQSSEISATVNATTVRELPLNGRSWTDLAALQPGVSTIQTQPGFQTGSDRGNRGFGQELTISGARPQQNNYRLDGVSLNDYANGAPGSVLGGNLGVDAIQEFSVLTSNYSAEYGKTSGGVVNAITRSGTNAVHGSVYEFLRNSAVDARNYFELPTDPKASFRKNQFGGAIGGPIIKNRTFFFADYEGIRQSKGIANKLFVPSVNARSGMLSTGAVPVDATIQKYLGLYPIPGPNAVCGADTCQVDFNGQQVVNEDFITTRIDHRFSDKDALSGTYLYDKTPYSSPDSFGNVGLTTLSSRQIVAVEENHTFTPTFLNAIRFGYNHEKVDNDATSKALNTVASNPALGVFPNRDASVVIVSGGVLTQMNGGVGGLPTYFYRWNSYQLYDDAFVNRGAHTIKFGFAAERLHLYAVAQTDPNGVWTFPDLPSFLQNQPSKFAGGDIRTATPRNFRQSIFGGYVQDDWRWKPSLTFNMGLRYEMATVMTETAGKLVNLRTISDQFPVCGALDAGGFCSGKGPLFLSNPTLHNFEPRIGFAWDPLHTGRMAVRGGIGLFDVLPLPYQFILSETQATPFFQYLSLNNTHADGSALSIAQLPLGDYGSNKLRSSYIESRPHRNYVIQWNLNMQYQLTSNLAALVAYVGSRGIHQPFKVEESDLTYPTLVKGVGYVWPYDTSLTDGNFGGPLPPVNPNYSSIKGMFYDGHSYYDALELQLAKRMSHGLQMQGTFTWAKSIDTSSATLAGDSFGNSVSSLHYFDLRLSRGPSDFNVPRTLVINGTWEVPTPKSWTGPKHWLADGWELGTIFTVSDGVPFTPTWGTGGDPANTNSSDDFAFPNRVKGVNNCTNPGNPTNYINANCFAVPTAPNMAFWTANCDPQPPSLQPSSGPPVLVTFPTCFNLRGNSGRNILKGPGITDLDFSIFKNNRVKRISENFNVQFRVEMFNIMNHPNFAPPGPGDGNTDVFDATGASFGSSAGQLFRTTIPERQIQFAIKILF